MIEMKKIISSVLVVVMVFSVCVIYLSNIQTPAGTASKVAYTTVNENTVKTSETVVYEYTSIKSDLQGVNTDPERMSESSAGGALSKLQKALLGTGLGSVGIWITIGLSLLLLL